MNPKIGMDEYDNGEKVGGHYIKVDSRIVQAKLEMVSLHELEIRKGLENTRRISPEAFTLTFDV